MMLLSTLPTPNCASEGAPKSFINLFLAVCSLCHCRRAFSSRGKRALLRSGARACCGGFSYCRAQALGHSGISCFGTRTQLPYTRGTSKTRDQTHVPCIDRWILNYWTTRKVPRACKSLKEVSTSQLPSAIIKWDFLWFLLQSLPLGFGLGICFR